MNFFLRHNLHLKNMSFPLFEFFVNGRHDYSNGGYRFSFLYQVSSERKEYSEPIYIEFQSKKILLPSEYTGTPYTFWVIVFENTRFQNKKKNIPYKVVYQNGLLTDGNIVYIPPEEKNVNFNISSCNINYNSNTEFQQYLLESGLSRPGKIYDRTLLRHLYKEASRKKCSNDNIFDVWLHIGDNIYEGIFNRYKDGTITLSDVLDIQRKYYINSYNEECQGYLMRHCINLMIQDNNEYYSRIGQFPEYTSLDPFFKNYFETIYVDIVQKYQVFLFHKENGATGLTCKVKVGFYDILFVNNIYTFYDTMINLPDKTRSELTSYLESLRKDQPPIVIMSRALENYTPVVSNRSTIRKSNTFKSQYDYYLLFRKTLLESGKTCFTVGGDNHFYFLKKLGGHDACIYDACSSGISVIDDDDDFDENILSVILDNEKDNQFITWLRSKDYSTLLLQFRDSRKARYKFISYNSDTASRTRTDKSTVYF